MNPFVRAGVAFACAWASFCLTKPAMAEGEAWSCWHHETNMHCMPSVVASDEELASPYQRALMDARYVELQERGEWIIIPLHATPRNWGNVQRLVESVLCSGQPGCTVHLNQGALKAALVALPDLPE